MENGIEIGQVEPSHLLEDLQSSSSAQVHFEPMDSRHLASLPLIRSRVMKLLKSSKNNMHESTNMLLTIVKANLCPSKNAPDHFCRVLLIQPKWTAGCFRAKFEN
jgi:hypothetical protein